MKTRLFQRLLFLTLVTIFDLSRKLPPKKAIIEIRKILDNPIYGIKK